MVQAPYALQERAIKTALKHLGEFSLQHHSFDAVFDRVESSTYRRVDGGTVH